MIMPVVVICNSVSKLLCHEYRLVGLQSVLQSLIMCQFDPRLRVSPVRAV